jgi:hypothetical protein
MGPAACQIRPGKHEVTTYDGKRCMDFADVRIKSE